MMAASVSSQKNSNSNKRRHSYSTSTASSSSTFSFKRSSRWSQPDEYSLEAQEVNTDGRKRSKSFLEKIKSRTLKPIRRNSASSSTRETKSPPTTPPIIELQEDYIRVIVTILNPQFNYKTLPIEESTTAHDVIVKLMNKYATNLEDRNPDTFYLTEVRESEQGSYSRLLEDNERVYDIQKRWKNGKMCCFELCRRQICVSECENFTDSPIQAIVLSPSQDSFFSQDCGSPVSLTEFIFPSASSQSRENQTLLAGGSIPHHIRSCETPTTPSDTSEANSVDTVDVYTRTLPPEQPTQTRETEIKQAVTFPQNSGSCMNTGSSSLANIAKPDASLDQLVEESFHEQPRNLGVNDTTQQKSPTSDTMTLHGNTIHSFSNDEDILSLRTLVCSPVNPRTKTLPRFVFTSSIDREAQSSQAVKSLHNDFVIANVQRATKNIARNKKPNTIAQDEETNKSIVVTEISFGTPQRQSKTSRLMSDVKFETNLTVYPKFKVTASLFPTFAQQYSTHMNIFESLSSLLESRINRWRERSKEEVQKGVESVYIQHSKGDNSSNSFQISNESDYFSHTPTHTFPLQPTSAKAQRGRLTSESTREIRRPKFLRPHTFHYTRGTIINENERPVNRDERIYRAGMTVRRLQSTMRDRAFSSSTTCISSEIQSDLDALISQRQLSNQLNSQSLKSLLHPSNLRLLRTSTPIHTRSRSDPPSENSFTCDTRNQVPSTQRLQSFQSNLNSEKSRSLHALQSYRSPEVRNQHRTAHESSESEILYTFARNQRPITVLVRSKSSHSLHSHQDHQPTRSKSSTDLSGEYSRRRNRPKSAPHQRPQGHLAGLMHSIHQKADKQWWTEI